MPLRRKETGLGAHECTCTSWASSTCPGPPLHSSRMPRSLLDVLMVPASRLEGSLWPSCWSGRYQNPGERFISWIYTGRVQRPTFWHCYAELLPLNCKHVTWQFLHTTLSSLSGGTWTWLGGQHGAKAIFFPKGSCTSSLFLGGRRKCSAVM